MRPGHYDLVVKQGQTFEEYVVLKAANGTAYDISASGAHGAGTATAQVRDAAGGTLLLTLTCTIALGTDGKIKMAMSAATTAAASFNLGVWDLFVTFTDGTKWCILEGEASLSPKVTA